MITVRPFQPVGASTSISATTSSASAAITGVPRGTSTVRIVNSGTVVVFLKFGTSGVTAAVTDMPMLGGTVETFQIRNDITHVAAITSSGTATVYITSGESA